MDTNSMLLVLKLVSEGIGVSKEIADLAKRVQAGEKITDEEIEKSRRRMIESVKKWEDQTKSKQGQ